MYPDALMCECVVYFIITANLGGLIVSTLTGEESGGLAHSPTAGRVEWMRI